MIQVLIVDDDFLIQKSLERMLSKEEDIIVLGSVSDGSEVLEACKKLNPSLILMDIRMPKMNGIEATEMVKKHFPKTKILMLTTFQDREEIQNALQAGAEGYVLKTERLTSLSEKLRLLFKGAAVIDQEVLKTLAIRETNSLEELTKREKEVLELVAKGLSNKEIGEQLFLSDGTVRNIISAIMGKTNTRNRTQLSRVINHNQML